MTVRLHREIARLSTASPHVRVAVPAHGESAAAAAISRLGASAELVQIGAAPATCDVLALLGAPGRALGLTGLAALLPRVQGVRLCVIDLKLAPRMTQLAALAQLSEIGREAGLALAHWCEGQAAGGMRVFLQRPCHVADPVLALALDAFRLGDRAMTALTARGNDDMLQSAYARAARLDGWGATAPVREAMGAAASARGWSRERNRILVSIHIQSNSPSNLRKFFARIGNSCDDPSRVEVIVKIDDDHVELNEMLPGEVARQPFQLKYISTPLVGGFFELWRSMNDMLAITDPSAYFLLNLNDEMMFLDRGWDTRLARYVGLFPDDLFRLRTSIYRSRNYHDHWECGFAPETSAVTTKKWIETGGNWNPCLGPDTFQQCVAFYFNRLNWRLDKPQQREIPIEDIRFGGEGAYVGLTGEALRRRVRGATKAWFRLMSEEIQTEAAKRAAKIHAAIAAYRLGLGADAVVIDESKRAVTVRDSSGAVVERIAYGAAPHWYTAVNTRRALQFGAYGGGGATHMRALPHSVAAFLALRYDWADRLRRAMVSGADVSQLDGVSRALRPILRIPYYIAHAPDYMQLFYLRRVRHWINVCDLIARRSASALRNGLWWAFIGGPRRAIAYADLAARRTGAGVLGHVLGFAVRSARFAKRCLWWALIGAPRWLIGHTALAYHVSTRWLVGHCDLAARRSWGAIKQAAWWTLIGAPRWLAGHIDLAARRSWGALRIAAWWTLIGAPRWLAGHIDLAARRSWGALRIAAWWTLIGAPRWLAGHIDLAARRSFGAAKVAAWQVLIGAPRRLFGRRQRARQPAE